MDTDKKKRVLLPSERYPDAPLIERHITLDVLPSCCGCGGTQMHDTGMTEDSEYLTVIPKQHLVVRQMRLKYGCGKCHGDMKPAPAPSKIIVEQEDSKSNTPTSTHGTALAYRTHMHLSISLRRSLSVNAITTVILFFILQPINASARVPWPSTPSESCSHILSPEILPLTEIKRRLNSRFHKDVAYDWKPSKIGSRKRATWNAF